MSQRFTGLFLFSSSSLGVYICLSGVSFRHWLDKPIRGLGPLKLAVVRANEPAARESQQNGFTQDGPWLRGLFGLQHIVLVLIQHMLARISVRAACWSWKCSIAKGCWRMSRSHEFLCGRKINVPSFHRQLLQRRRTGIMVHGGEVEHFIRWPLAINCQELWVLLKIWVGALWKLKNKNTNTPQSIKININQRKLENISKKCSIDNPLFNYLLK